MANTWITMTQPSGGSRRKWTWSAWVKKSSTGANQSLCVAYQDSANWTSINFETSDQLNFYEYQGSSVVGQKKLSMMSRDTNGWYHFMIIWDSENTTADDRMIIYVNGVRQTAFSASTNPAVNTSTAMNRNGYPVRIGTNNSNNYFNGSMSHVNFCGGSVLAPTVFGETDATTGEWKIISDPTFTPGIGGYSILKNGNSLTDQSANSNNFSLGGGTLTDTKDCPSTVFATWNPLNYDYANNPSSFTNGNTQVTPTQATAYNTGVSTLAMPKGNGKFYTEIKYISSGNVNGGFGIIDMDYVNKIYYENYNLMEENTVTTIGRVFYGKNGAVVTGGGVETGSFGGTWSNGDIIQIACDMENGAIYFGKNGTWQNSGVPTSGASRTGAVNTSAASWWTETSQWGLWCGKKISTTDLSFQANFGNGYFGTTAVSSAGTNASNNGIFEYDVPTGYTALSTRGLNL